MSTYYDEIGGMETITAIVHRFYEGVAGDEVLRPLYPEEDLGPAEERFRLFLAQYWGGPTTYSDNRGHPRLRQRHAPFPVDQHARDRWMALMNHALDRTKLPSDVTATLRTFFDATATFMINRH